MAKISEENLHKIKVMSCLSAIIKRLDRIEKQLDILTSPSHQISLNEAFRNEERNNTNG